MAATLAATWHSFTSLPPAAILAVILVVVVMLACTLARFTAKPADDNGLNYEGHR